MHKNSPLSFNLTELIMSKEQDEMKLKEKLLSPEEQTAVRQALIEFIPYLSGAKIPSYATRFSSGMDLCACIGKGAKNVTIYPGQTLMVETGLKCKMHKEIEGQVRSRSGLALNKGIIVLNAPGTVDADYEGPLNVILHNVSVDPYVITHGDRIAQFVLNKIEREENYMSFDTKERGEGGFGSTGLK